MVEFNRDTIEETKTLMQLKTRMQTVSIISISIISENLNIIIKS